MAFSSIPDRGCRRRFLGVLAACALGTTRVSFGNGTEMIWTPLRNGGREYLPLDQVGAFYRLGALRRAGRGFELGSGGAGLRGELESREFWISRIKFLLSYPVIEVAGILCISRLDLVKLVEPVLRPGRIEGAASVDTVVLDPGHGGEDRGAVGMYGDEKQYTLDVAFRAAQILSRAGYRVVLTRSKDEFVSLEERTRIANRCVHALFVSIHFNSGGNGTGVETYALSPPGVPSMSQEGVRVSEALIYPGNVRDAENSALATAAHAALVANLGLLDRGVKRARFQVIRETVLPGVLLESGFLSCLEDARKIASPWFRQQIAGSLLQAVQNYGRAVQSG